MGPAYLIADLETRPELNGKRGLVLSTDVSSGLVAVKLGTGEAMKVRVSNLLSGIFATSTLSSA